MKLFWFLRRRHANQFFANGKMYFGHCSRYEDASLATAQRDSEARRSARFTPTEMRLRVGDDPKEAIEVPFTSVEFASNLPTYFLRSLSTKFRRGMLKELGADAVVEFFDFDRLVVGVEVAVSKQLNTGQWRFVRKPVDYLSRHELIQIDTVVDRMFAKERGAYGTQAEFRLVLIPEHRFPGARDPHLFLYLEDAASFARQIV